MRKSFFSGLVMMCLIFLIGSPALAEKGSFYFGAHGGLNHMHDIVEGVVEDVDMEPFGYAYGAAIGYRFKNIEGADLRVEGEVTLRQNDGDKYQGMDLDGEVTSEAVLVNAAVEFANNSRITPYILVGAGGAHVSFNDFAVLGMLLEDDSDTVFAYQFGVGGAFNLTDHFALDLGYRYFATSLVEMTDEFGVTHKSNYQNHNLMLGVRFLF